MGKISMSTKNHFAIECCRDDGFTAVGLTMPISSQDLQI